MYENEHVPVSKDEFKSIVYALDEVFGGSAFWDCDDCDYHYGTSGFMAYINDNLSERFLMYPVTRKELDESYPCFTINFKDEKTENEGFVEWTFGEKTLEMKKTYTITINSNEEIDIDEIKKNHPTARIETSEYYAD